MRLAGFGLAARFAGADDYKTDPSGNWATALHAASSGNNAVRLRKARVVSWAGHVPDLSAAGVIPTILAAIAFAA